MKKIPLSLLFLLLCGLTASAQSLKSRSITKASLNELTSENLERLALLRSEENPWKVHLLQAQNLEKVKENGDIEIVLPGKSNMTFTNLKRRVSGGDRVSWESKNKDQEIKIFQNGRKIFGFVKSDDFYYEISYLNDRYYVLLEYDLEVLSNFTCSTASHTHDLKRTRNGSGLADKEIPELNSSQLLGIKTINVLILYTQAVVNTGKNIAEEVTKIEDEWSLVANQSKVNINLSVAAVVQINSFTENSEPGSQTIYGSVNMRHDLDVISNNLEAQTLRNQYSADVVMLLTNGNYTPSSGVANFAAYWGEQFAFGISQINSATGSSFTFAHEMGHILGAQHEIEAVSLDLPAPVDAYAHEWVGPDNKNYRSIMRTASGTGGTRVGVFSNPDVTIDGIPTGVAGSANNARVVNLHASLVASFRIAPSTNIQGPVNAQTGNNLFFTATTTGQGLLSYQWQVKSGSTYINVGSGTSLNYTMPNNDLELKLTVTDSYGNSDTDTHLVTNYFLGGGCTFACPDLDPEAFVESLPVFPNPATDILHVPTSGEYAVLFYEVTTIDGKLLLKSSERVEGQRRLSIDVSQLPQAQYIVKLIDGDEETFYKFIKK